MMVLPMNGPGEKKHKTLKGRHKKQNHKRRGLFEGLAVKEQWLAARSWLKMTGTSVAAFIMWSYICICVSWEKVSGCKVWKLVSFLLFSFERELD